MTHITNFAGWHGTLCAGSLSTFRPRPFLRGAAKVRPNFKRLAGIEPDIMYGVEDY